MRIFNQLPWLLRICLVLSFVVTTARAEPPIILTAEPPNVDQGKVQEIIVSAVPNLPGIVIIEVVLYLVNDRDLPLEDLGLLRDNGSFGDAVPNDGIYSAMIVANAVEEPLRFRALVRVADFPKPVYSDTLVLQVK